MKICLAGEGAQGITHMQTLRKMEGIEVVSLTGGIEEDTAAFAKEWGIPHYSMQLEESLQQPGVEAVILGSPNQVHCEQAVMAMEMGKHVLVEIPMGMTLEESQRVVEMEEKTGLVCMVCHSNRYNNVFREVHRRVREGELALYHIVHQTFFFRRTNENRFGKPRTWVDNLLWHQTCHTIDMVYWLLDDPDMAAWGQTGPMHPTLDVPMDITIGLKAKNGCLVTGAQSFNNHGRIQGLYRFIGEEATLVTDKGKLMDHEGNEVPVGAGGGMVDQDGEFFAAIKEGRKALTSCSACLPVMGIIDRVQKAIEAQG